MALPALPPSNTRRIKVSYNVGPDNHSFIVRVSDVATSTQITAAVSAVLNAIAGQIYLMTITAVEQAAKTSNVFLPLSSTLIGATYGTAIPSGQARSWFYSFTGRSRISGRKTMMELFVAKTISDSTFRVTIPEGAWVDNTLNAFYTYPSDVWLAIDGYPVQWHVYANVKQNDHMVKKLRGGG